MTGALPAISGGCSCSLRARCMVHQCVPGLKSLARLRRRRNQAEYPDPAGYDLFTLDEAHDAIAVGASAVDSSRRLIDRPEIGFLR